MSGTETVLALSHPLVVAMLGSAVLIIWRNDRNHPRYLLYFGIAYLAYSVAVTVQITMVPSYVPFNVFSSGVLYMLAVILLTHGLVVLSGRRYSYWIPILVSIIMLAARLYFTLIDNDTKLRLFLLNSAVFVIFLHGAALARDLRKGHIAEKVLYFSFLGLTVSTAPRILSGISRPADQYGFDASIYWLVTQFSVYIFAVVFMVSLILTIMLKRILAHRELSETDHLTGLRNRRGFLVTVMRLMSRVDKYAVIVADIDRFKKVNDAHGHAVGDAVLVETAHIIESSIRPLDVSGRIGGEEFAIFLPQATLNEGHNVAERLRRNFEQNDFLHGKLNLKCTISMGVTAFENATPIAQALTAADHLLYRAKAEGRNRVVSNAAAIEEKAQTIR